MKTSLKIGGITGPEALSLIPEGGAAGFHISLEGSPNSLPPEAVAPLVEKLSSGVEAWAVVVGPSAELIRRLYEEVGVDRIQVYGAIPQGLEFLEIHHLVPSVPVPAPGAAGPDPAVPPAEDYPRIHLDRAGTPYRDGSAERPDWAVCSRLIESNPGRKFTLAGGLSPENVVSALREVRPWGIDVTRGVESAPGRIDLARLQEFIRAIEEFERSGAPA